MMRRQGCPLILAACACLILALSAIAVDAKGRIVAAGYREVKNRPEQSGFVLARFLSRQR
jgi:ribosomal protein S8E